MQAALATGDFETYGEAGFVWEEPSAKWNARKNALEWGLGKWGQPKGASGTKKGLSVVGAAVYSEHPATEVLTFSYKLPQIWWNGHAWNYGGFLRRWKPGEALPEDLFAFLRAGGLFEAHNIAFERLIWKNVCVEKYGWPDPDAFFYQFRCSMAQANVSGYPGALANLTEVLGGAQKDPEGRRLIQKFSVPRSPTKKDARLRIFMCEDPVDGEKFCTYCDGDVLAEESAHEKMPPMSEAETQFWLIDQEINWRGVGVDRKGIRDCTAVLEQALDRYGDEQRAITGFEAGQLAALQGWLAARGVVLPNMQSATIDAALEPPSPFAPPPKPMDPLARRVLEIRQLIGSASVKKLYAMGFQANRRDRLQNLIIHHGTRTGRPTGEGPQPLNLPKAGPDLKWCKGCASPYAEHHGSKCPWCAALHPPGLPKTMEWSAEACDFALAVMATQSLERVEHYFGDALLTISGCLRGLFVAGPGMDLIASDFSAIEAVVTAMLAGEEWRIEAFRQKQDIYYASAARITGRTMEFYLQFKETNKHHHPDRQKIGKPAELGLGFGGWVNAWLQFDKSGTFSEEEIKRNILGWRDASPGIVELWGGQTRREGYARRPERFGFEGAAVSAIERPGEVFVHAGIQFFMRGDALMVRLLSGRELTYREPRLNPSVRQGAQPWEQEITYRTWNTNPKYGAKGWVVMKTYGGRLTENIVQATAHDILRYAIVNLRAAGYPTVLHVYDEIVVEVPKGTGSVEEVERIMATMPPWAFGWPIRADGGWRGFRYRKG